MESWGAQQPAQKTEEQPEAVSSETLAKNAWLEAQGKGVKVEKVESANEAAINEITKWEKLKNLGRSVAETTIGTGAVLQGLYSSFGGEGIANPLDAGWEGGLVISALVATGAGLSLIRWMKKDEKINETKKSALEKLGHFNN